ncbi:MAG: 5-oxoprolinase subunit PxpA [Planctomycetota bacterium]|nr:5-oxoprolinase subunit PxpA [Planctomycetota bacterium]
MSTHRYSMDLNCDCGEGMPHDRELMQYVSSASIACGEHAGDAVLMLRTVRLAKKRGVVIGAHPSFPGRRGFGRLAPKRLDYGRLAKSLFTQISRLNDIAVSQGVAVVFVKPHGALYSVAARDANAARCVVEAAATAAGACTVVGMRRSALGDACRRTGLPFIPEAFPDRAYDRAGTLVSRALPGAVIEDPGQVADRAVRMALRRDVISIEGKRIQLATVRTLCIHGDSAHATEAARAVRRGLETAGVSVEPFVGGSLSLWERARVRAFRTPKTRTAKQDDMGREKPCHDHR